MLRFDYQGTAGNAGVIRSRRIVFPCPATVLILPCRDCHALHLCRQRCLFGSNQCGVGVVLKHIGVSRQIRQPCVLCIADQRIGDVSGNIDGILRLRVVIADIAKVGEHTGCSCRQLIGIDRQDAFGYALPRSQRCFCSVSFLPLPRNRKPRSVQRQIGLIKKHHRRKHQMCTGPVRRIGMRQHIRIFNLRLWQIGCDIGRQFPLVCNIHKGLLAGS